MRSDSIFIAVSAAVISILPLILFTINGDLVMNLMQVSCYSKQLWSGISYPHWCVDANGAMGSPAPIFYFPLAFYIAALFYPFTSDVNTQYILANILAGMVAFAGTVIWLKPVAGRKVALFCACAFVLGNYRIELAVTRQSYAELWCLSFLPFVFWLVRAMLYEEKTVWPALAVILALCLLSHPPATLIALIAVGLQVLWRGKRVFPHLIEVFAAFSLAVLLVLFHLLPVRLLVDTLNPDMGGLDYWRQSWVNGFADAPAMVSLQNALLFSLFFSFYVVMVLAVYVWRGCKNIADTNIAHEAKGWMFTMAVAFMMMFSLSAPLWDVIEYISMVKTPWRMGLVVGCGTVYLLAVLLRWLRCDTRTQNGDMLLILMLLIAMGMINIRVAKPESYAHLKRVTNEQLTLSYFSPAALDKKYGTMDFFSHDFIDRADRSRAEWASGSGQVRVRQWDAQAIMVSGHAQTPGILRLEHFYYPIWNALLNGNPVSIAAEKDKGRMLINIPAGDFDVVLTQHFSDMLPGWFSWIWLSSLFATLVIAWGGYKQRLALQQPQP